MIILREHAHKNFAKIPKRRKKKEQLNGETVKSRTVHNYFHIGRGYSFTPGVWKILWLSGERTGSKPFPGLLTAYVFASVSKHWQFIRARKGGGSNPIDIAIEYRWRVLLLPPRKTGHVSLAQTHFCGGFCAFLWACLALFASWRA